MKRVKAKEKLNVYLGEDDSCLEKHNDVGELGERGELKSPIGGEKDLGIWN